MTEAVKEAQLIEVERKHLDQLAAEKLDYDVDTYKQCLKEYTALTCQHCVCRDTKLTYVREIERLTEELAEAELMTDKISSSLVDIDPNTENTVEGRAFARKMFESDGNYTYSEEPFLPKTPGMCVKMVSGKVIQI